MQQISGRAETRAQVSGVRIWPLAWTHWVSVSVLHTVGAKQIFVKWDLLCFGWLGNALNCPHPIPAFHSQEYHVPALSSCLWTFQHPGIYSPPAGKMCNVPGQGGELLALNLMRCKPWLEFDPIWLTSVQIPYKGIQGFSLLGLFPRSSSPLPINQRSHHFSFSQHKLCSFTLPYAFAYAFA